MKLTEQRSFPLRSELREAGEGYNFDGYASVFNSVTDLGPFRERVAETAFTKTVKDGADVRLLVNHDGVPLARTKSGTLVLQADDHGLRSFTPEDRPLDEANPTVKEVASAMRRGDLDQMSFAFQVVKDEWDDAPEDGGSPIRTIREARLFDVSVVTYPAYADTTAEMRSVAAVAVARGLEQEAQERAAEEPQHSEQEPQHFDALAVLVRNRNRRRRAMAGLAKAS